MNYNYHTHTFRCNHATELEEEYISVAIKNGIKFLGFSDHIPVRYIDGFNSRYRVPVNLADDYISTIKNLREKYKNEIEISIGFEMEYYPQMFEQMLNDAINWGAEYLILGEHFCSPEYDTINKNTVRYEVTPSTEEKDVKTYFETLTQGIKTGKFTYVCHPDICNFIGDDEIYDKHARPFIKSCKKYNIPLEINFLGIRTNRAYPTNKFWKIVGEEGAPVTFGLDSHSAIDAFDAPSLTKAKEMIKEFNLNYIGKPKLIPLK